MRLLFPGFCGFYGLQGLLGWLNSRALQGFEAFIGKLLKGSSLRAPWLGSVSPTEKVKPCLRNWFVLPGCRSPGPYVLFNKDSQKMLRGRGAARAQERRAATQMNERSSLNPKLQVNSATGSFRTLSAQGLGVHPTSTPKGLGFRV